MTQKRSKQPDADNQQPDAASSSPKPEQATRGGKRDYAKEHEALTAHLKRMELANQLIKDGFSAKQDVGAVTRSLLENGFDEDEIIEIMKAKPAANGKAYRGYTFTDVNEVKSQIEVLETLMQHGKSGGFASREMQRRQEPGAERSPG